MIRQLHTPTYTWSLACYWSEKIVWPITFSLSPSQRNPPHHIITSLCKGTTSQRNNTSNSLSLRFSVPLSPQVRLHLVLLQPPHLLSQLTRDLSTFLACSIPFFLALWLTSVTIFTVCSLLVSNYNGNSLGGTQEGRTAMLLQCRNRHPQLVIQLQLHRWQLVLSQCRDRHPRLVHLHRLQRS